MSPIQVLGIVALVAAIGVFGCARRRAGVEPGPARGVGASQIEVLPEPSPEPTEFRRKEPLPESAPGTVHQELPIYPEAAVLERISCAARLLYHIETDGSARLVRLEWDVAPPADHVEAFEAAIREAVAGWQFVPAYELRREELPDGKARLARRPIPKAVRAVVRFRVEAGRPIVE